MFVAGAERIKQPRNNKDKGLVVDIHPRAEHRDRAACLRYRQRPQLRPARKMDGWVVDDTPAIRSDLHHAPAVVRKIDVNSAIATGDANIDLALRALVGAAIQHADDRADGGRCRQPTGALVKMPLKPPAKLVTPDRQTLLMPADHEIDKCPSVPRVEEFAEPEIFLGFPLQGSSNHCKAGHDELPFFSISSMPTSEVEKRRPASTQSTKSQRRYLTSRPRRVKRPSRYTSALSCKLPSLSWTARVLIARHRSGDLVRHPHSFWKLPGRRQIVQERLKIGRQDECAAPALARRERTGFQSGVDGRPPEPCKPAGGGDCVGKRFVVHLPEPDRAAPAFCAAMLGQ